MTFCCNQLQYNVHVDVYTSKVDVFTDHSALYKPKAGNTEQDTYQLPFYCNFDFTSLVSAHAQTINEYPDTKRQIWMFGDNYPDNWVSVPALLCTQNDHIVSI